MIAKTTEAIFTEIAPKTTNFNENNEPQQNKEDSNNTEKEETNILGRKKRRPPKRVNNTYCAACEKSVGSLLNCSKCVRSYHSQCLKMNENDIPKDSWLCPICNLKNQNTRKVVKKDGKHKPNKKNKKQKAENAKKNNNKIKRENKMNNQDHNNKVNTNSNIKDSNKENFTENNFNPNINNNVFNTNNNEIKPNNNKEKKNSKKKGKGTKKIFENNNNTNNMKIKEENKEQTNEQNENKENNEREEEEYFGENNLISKNELINFLQNLNQKDIKGDNGISMSEEMAKVLKNINNIKIITNIINTNKELVKFKVNWNLLIEKKFSPKPNIRFPIKCRELYSNPEKYGLEEKYFNKTKGTIYPYINGKQFTRLINIYDFLITFSDKIYLNKFTLEELYSALTYSEKYNKSEIILLSSIHNSIIYVLMEELNEIPLQELYNNGEMQLLIIKCILDTIKDNIIKVFSFIYNSWTELVRLFLLSKTFIKDYNDNMENNTFLDKLYNIHDIIEYNTSINFEEKLSILEKLVVISYETNFIRYNIKEGQEQKNQFKKIKKEYDEELKDIEYRKSEFERHSKLTQPHARIEEINKKLEDLKQNQQNRTKSANDKMKAKLEDEKIELEKMINEMNENNARREELLNKIEELKEEIFDLPTIGRAYLGMDGRGFKYYYFTWMPKMLFLRTKNENREINEKYEWRVINNDEEELKNNLIDKLSEKGIEELKLKNKLLQVVKKFKNKDEEENNKDNKIIQDEENKMQIEKEQKNIKKNELSVENIFNDKVLKYQNPKNPLVNDKQNKVIFITEKTNQYEPISEKIKKIEINISKYLSLDNRQWESPTNRSKIKSWISTINSVSNFVNLLLFFNERVKTPYKSEFLSIADSLFGKSATRKIIEEEKDDDADENNSSKGGCPLIVNGNFEIGYINRDLQYANRIKLWTKEFETYNIEKIYLDYLRKVKGIPQVIICVNIFEIIVNELNKRRDVNKKKGDNFIPEIIKNDENKINFENINKNGIEGLNNIQIKKPKVKKKKLIEWNVKCMFCHEFGELLCCEDCPNVAHLNCAKLDNLPDVWKCIFCANNRNSVK